MQINIYHKDKEIKYSIFEAVQIFCGTDYIFNFIPESDFLALELLEDGNRVRYEIINENNSNDEKRKIYIILTEYTGYFSPWGCQTGIRPAKMVNLLFEKGLSENEVIANFRDCFVVSDNKIKLAIQTAKNQSRFLIKDNNSSKKISLYANLPFCPSRCLYCSFTSNSIVKYKKSVDPYLDSMEREIIATAQLIKDYGYEIESLYLGGGTPTSLNEEQFERYMNLFVKHFDLSSLIEFSLEAGRPDSITENKLRVAIDCNVNRISINPQTMNDSTLDLIGRKHCAQDIDVSFDLARKVGFNNINMDIIAGLPGEDEDMFAYTLDRIKHFNPEGMTVHTLSIKRAANLKTDVDKQKLLSPDNIGRMLALSENAAYYMGMQPFYMYRQKHMLGNHENVSYCKPGFESPYNIHIMEEDQTVIAVGAGGVTKAVFENGRIERAYNVKSVEDYMKRMPEMIERKKILLGGSV